MNVNITFPSTPYVECVFSLKTSNNKQCIPGDFDQYDICSGSKKATLKRYVYKLPEDMVGYVKPGDFVLVHCATGYQPCEVVTVNALTSFEDDGIQPVVCPICIQPYIDRVEQKKALKAMRSQIEAEKKRLESLVTYELIAEKNPEFKAMLDAFKAAGGSL